MIPVEGAYKTCPSCMNDAGVTGGGVTTIKDQQTDVCHCVSAVAFCALRHRSEASKSPKPRAASITDSVRSSVC